MGINYCSKKLKAAAACAALLVCLSIQSPAHAAAGNTVAIPRCGMDRFSLLENQVSSLVETRATETYVVKVPARSALKASSSFSMSAGETITISATYSPSTAKLNVGLIYADGSFHYFTATGGQISKTIEVKEGGTYTLAIQNTASYDVTVSGFVNY